MSEPSHQELIDLLAEARDLIIAEGESMDITIQFPQHAWLRRVNEIVPTDHKPTPPEDKVAKLRRALSGLVGVNTKEELDQMEAMLRLMPAPDCDKAAMINAIEALRETL